MTPIPFPVGRTSHSTLPKVSLQPSSSPEYRSPAPTFLASPSGVLVTQSSLTWQLNSRAPTTPAGFSSSILPGRSCQKPCSHLQHLCHTSHLICKEVLVVPLKPSPHSEPSPHRQTLPHSFSTLIFRSISHPSEHRSIGPSSPAVEWVAVDRRKEPNRRDKNQRPTCLHTQESYKNTNWKP